MKNVIRVFLVSTVFSLIAFNSSAQEKKAGLVKAERKTSAKTKVNAPVKVEKVSPGSSTVKNSSSPKYIAKEKFDQLPPEKQKFILDNPKKYTVGK